MTNKIAVILLNLGGPLKREDIRPFLINFFSDPLIIRTPAFIRYFIARMIANRRSKKEALLSYERLGFKSPLLENTQKQATALEKKLGENFKVFTVMRYWHPRASVVAQEVNNYKPDDIVLLPLYPQFSTTTTKSSFLDFLSNSLVSRSITKICCYPIDDGFIDASCDLVQKSIKTSTTQYPDIKFRVLFSAHGLPENIIKAGDPYQSHCEATAKAIADKLGLTDWQICYQSRVGRLKWIGPSTEQALEKAAQDKVGVIIYPLAFVSDHVETLVEIEEEYRHLASELGVPAFFRVPTVMDHPVFIAGLARLVTSALENKGAGVYAPVHACKKTCKECLLTQG